MSQSDFRHVSATVMKTITYENIARLFDRPLVQAATELGISDTYLKKLCRSFKIAKWPFRRMLSLRNKKSLLLEKGVESTCDQDIQDLEREIERIYQTGVKDDNKTKFGRGVRKKSPPSKQARKKSNVEKNKLWFQVYNRELTTSPEQPLQELTTYCTAEIVKQEISYLECSQSYRQVSVAHPLPLNLNLNLEEIMNELYSI
jgi:hypothetical protein